MQYLCKILTNLKCKSEIIILIDKGKVLDASKTRFLSAWGKGATLLVVGIATSHKKRRITKHISLYIIKHKL